MTLAGFVPPGDDVRVTGRNLEHYYRILDTAISGETLGYGPCAFPDF